MAFAGFTILAVILISFSIGIKLLIGGVITLAGNVERKNKMLGAVGLAVGVVLVLIPIYMAIRVGTSIEKYSNVEDEKTSDYITLNAVEGDDGSYYTMYRGRKLVPFELLNADTGNAPERPWAILKYPKGKREYIFPLYNMIGRDLYKVGNTVYGFEDEEDEITAKYENELAMIAEVIYVSGTDESKEIQLSKSEFNLLKSAAENGDMQDFKIESPLDKAFYLIFRSPDKVYRDSLTMICENDTHSICVTEMTAKKVKGVEVEFAFEMP